MKDADGHSSSGWTKNRYKAWAVAAILLLAIWSMLSGSAGLARKWSVVTQNPFAFITSKAAAHDDADALEMEMREKLVRRAWDGYRFNPRAKEKLSSFWHDAFEAAFEDLDSENASVNEAAVKEIAKLSIPMFDLDLHTGRPKP